MIRYDVVNLGAFWLVFYWREYQNFNNLAETTFAITSDQATAERIARLLNADDQQHAAEQRVEGVRGE